MDSKSEAEILNFSKLAWDAAGLVQWVTDSRVCKQMSGGDPRTWIFHQMWVTVGDIACSVKGVTRTCIPHFDVF